MKSDCCDAPVIPYIIWLDIGTSDSSSGWYCLACHKQCNIYYGDDKPYKYEPNNLTKGVPK